MDWGNFDAEELPQEQLGQGLHLASPVLAPVSTFAAQAEADSEEEGYNSGYDFGYRSDGFDRDLLIGINGQLDLRRARRPVPRPSPPPLRPASHPRPRSPAFSLRIIIPRSNNPGAPLAVSRDDDRPVRTRILSRHLQVDQSDG